MLIIYILFACGDKTTDTSQSSTTTEPSHAYHGCTGQAQEQCDEFSHCTSIFASAITPDEEQECSTYGESEYVGCREDRVCDDSIAFAQSSEELVCYTFTSTCIPEGWVDCSSRYEQECPE